LINLTEKYITCLTFTVSAGPIMSEEDSFRQLFKHYCKEEGYSIVSDYPNYELSDGKTAVSIRVIDPFIQAQIFNGRIIKKALPKTIMEIV
jgi:hypothetical protein